MADIHPAVTNRRMPRRRQGLLLFPRVLAFAASAPFLARLSLRRLAAVLEPRHPPRDPDPARVAAVLHSVERALRVGSPIVRESCLTRGLTYFYFLRRAGVDVSLAFGVGRREGQYRGHCWLVKDGEPYLEREDPRRTFTETYRISQKTPEDGR
jgi:hypothetical protein